MDDPIELMHELLTVELLNRLKAPACDKCGTHGFLAAELTVIRQFLSDNEMKRALRPTPRTVLAELPFNDPEEIVQKLA